MISVVRIYSRVLELAGRTRVAMQVRDEAAGLRTPSLRRLRQVVPDQPSVKVRLAQCQTCDAIKRAADRLLGHQTASLYVSVTAGGWIKAERQPSSPSYSFAITQLFGMEHEPDGNLRPIVKTAFVSDGMHAVLDGRRPEMKALSDLAVVAPENH